MLSFIKGNLKSAAVMLRLLGLVGSVLAIWIHFRPWYIIETGGDNVVRGGADTLPLALVMLCLAIYILALLLDSVYALLPALCFFAYSLEALWGANLLRYMPLEMTKLTPELYLGLPMSAWLMLFGGLAPLMTKIKS